MRIQMFHLAWSFSYDLTSGSFMEPFIWYILFLQIFLEWNTEAYIYIYIYIFRIYCFCHWNSHYFTQAVIKHFGCWFCTCTGLERDRHCTVRRYQWQLMVRRDVKSCDSSYLSYSFHIRIAHLGRDVFKCQTIPLKVCICFTWSFKRMRQ